MTFYLAGNTDSRNFIHTMRVEAGGQSADFTFDTTGRNNNNMGWTPQSWQFTANTTQTTLQFTSLSDSPALDNVRVEAVSSANISINDVAITEGNSGIAQARFTVSLSNPSRFPISVDYSTRDGRGITGARSGQDYLSVGGTLRFRRGQTSKTIIVPIVGDTTHEIDETFFVKLRNPVGAGLTGSQGIGIIVSDDNTRPEVGFSNTNIRVREGNRGVKNLSIPVTLSNPSRETVLINYRTVNGSAIADQDYLLASGTLRFNHGETRKNIKVGIFGDLAVEPNETLRLELFAPRNATLGTSIANVTLVNDDRPSRNLGNVRTNLTCIIHERIEKKLEKLMQSQT